MSRYCPHCGERGIEPAVVFRYRGPLGLWCWLVALGRYCRICRGAGYRYPLPCDSA